MPRIQREKFLQDAVGRKTALWPATCRIYGSECSCVHSNSVYRLILTFRKMDPRPHGTYFFPQTRLSGKIVFKIRLQLPPNCIRRKRRFDSGNIFGPLLGIIILVGCQARICENTEILRASKICAPFSVGERFASAFDLLMCYLLSAFGWPSAEESTLILRATETRSPTNIQNTSHLHFSFHARWDHLRSVKLRLSSPSAPTAPIKLYYSVPHMLRPML